MIPVPNGERSTYTEDFSTKITGPSTRESISGFAPLRSKIDFRTGFSFITSSSFIKIKLKIRKFRESESGYKA